MWIPPNRINRLRTGTVALCAVGVMLAVGCTLPSPKWLRDDWVADYETAEAKVRETGRGLLIAYLSDRRTPGDHLQETLRSDGLEHLTRDYVRCVLTRSYEPDRRYVAQYGVERAPALIIVRPDGTYHAKSGPISTTEITRLLNQAGAPGARPVKNPYIPRKARYNWLESLDEARRESRATGRPLLTVFYRSLSRDRNRIDRILARPEVHRRFAGMVHCRVAIGGLAVDSFITRYGALRLPALVVAHPNGIHHMLEMPTSYESVVRFADTATRGSR